MCVKELKLTHISVISELLCPDSAKPHRDGATLSSEHEQARHTRKRHANRVPRYSGEVALAARVQRFRGVAPTLHTSLPAGIPQIPAAGQRRPAGLRASPEEAVGRQGPQQRGGGDAGGEGRPAGHPQPLGAGADAEPEIALAASDRPGQLPGAAALWHQRSGIKEHQLRYAALGTGLCETVTSVACFLIIEKTGKKVLLLRGYTGMSAVLILLTITLYFQKHVSWLPYCSLVLIFLFIFCFASGPAGATAPLAGDLFTQQFKSAAYIIACTINWICLFVVGMVFPIIVEHLQAFCFLIFLFFCISCGLFIKFNVPEIKNLTALQIAAEFQKMHAKGNESKTTEVNKFPTQETKL